MRRIWSFLVCLLLFTSVGRAQSVDVITLNVPDSVRDDIRPLLADFETTYNIRVVLSDGTDNSFLTSPAENLEQHLNDLQAYAESADVLYVNTRSTLTMAGIQTGYLLDLTPLVASDSQIIPADMWYPHVQQTITYDSRLWMLPTVADVQLLAYDEQSFDRAGLTYPQPDWTLDNLLSAAQQLPDGIVLNNSAAARLHLAASGGNLVDEIALPAKPNLTNPLMTSALETWLAAGDVIQQSAADLIDPTGRGTALTFGSYFLFDTTIQSSAAIPQASASFAHVDVSGFAISSGTSQPEQAYNLTRFLAQSPDVQAVLRGGVPAWRYQWDEFAATSTLTDDYLRAAQQVLERPGVSATFLPYLESAIAAGTINALVTVQQRAETDLQTAITRQQTPVRVNPVMLPETPDDGITLTFAPLHLNASNRSQWKQTIDDFVTENNSGVNAIELVNNPGSTAWDCRVLPAVALMNQRETLTNITPLLQADATYQPDDLIPGALDTVSFDNQVFGLPLYAEPLTMFYNTEAFDTAGLPYPAQNWTYGDFTVTLNSLDGLFAPRGNAGITYLMLIAAAGGLPIQRGETIPDYDFTSPQTIDAIRSVLDLAKAGKINYERLEYISVIPFVMNPQLFSDTPGNVSVQQRTENNYQIVAFPAGTTYQPVSYYLMTGVINRSTPYIEACYRWLSFLTDNQQVFSAMPAWRSQFEAAGITQGPEAEAFYRYFDNLLGQPDAVLIRSAGRIERTFIDHFLFQAFNAYVLDDVALETVLTTAQQQADDFVSCVQAIDNDNNYSAEVINCAIFADPQLADVVSSSG